VQQITANSSRQVGDVDPQPSIQLTQFRKIKQFVHSSLNTNMSEAARKKWEAENKIESIEGDQLYAYDNQKYQSYLSTKPWTKE
jgi:hypothetical protein